MTTVVGGLRARLIWDSTWNTLNDALGALGWFAPNQEHRPIVFLTKPVSAQQEIQVNTLALADEGETEREEELGSNLAEHRWTFYFDFYAEDDVIGKHLIYDVKDILGGRMPTIGRGDPSITVYDYRQATPTRLFVVQIEDILVDRAHDFPKPWQQHWYSARFTIVDDYGSG